MILKYQSLLEISEKDYQSSQKCENTNYCWHFSIFEEDKCNIQNFTLAVKLKHFQLNEINIFSTFAYSLEPPPAKIRHNKKFLLKIFNFCNLKNICIFHGRIFVMFLLYSRLMREAAATMMTMRERKSHSDHRTVTWSTKWWTSLDIVTLKVPWKSMFKLLLFLQSSNKFQFNLY